MKSEDIVRSWKDEDYRLSLSNAEQSLLPDHPAGLIELTDAELNGVDGGTDCWSLISICGPSHISICIPTMYYAPCSLFGGCPTGGPVFCLPE
ncbi:MAG TPA: mersacidin/lichenicidin family type 2 lantibiotic [Blastocatellia bacterium]|nr:mersacidin/lichenicidin family type 2 lantibiotic [Blastocatellia bacterium]